MGSRIFTLATTVALAGTVSAASAQVTAAPSSEPLTKSQIAVACSPPPIVTVAPADAPRIAGSQDVVLRGTFGTPELLVINAGTTRGLQVNQQYFVRRLFRTAETYRDKLPHTVLTAGWVRIVAANEKTAIATPDHACGDIREGDYLEPFEAPALPDGDIFTPVTRGEPDFENYSRVLYGPLERRSAGTGEFIFINHGADRNITVGSHFAIWRDLQAAGIPLTTIGEATAVSIGPTRSVLLVTRSRDAVFTNDVVVPRIEDGPAAGAATSAAATSADATPEAATSASTAADTAVEADDALRTARQAVDEPQSTK